MKVDQENVTRAQKFAPELPWNCWDPVQLGGCLMKYMEDQEPFYARWAETWYQNFQFVYGNQSLRWSRRYGYAVDSDFLRGAPAQNMRAQTNVSRAARAWEAARQEGGEKVALIELRETMDTAAEAMRAAEVRYIAAAPELSAARQAFGQPVEV